MSAQGLFGHGQWAGHLRDTCGTPAGHLRDTCGTPAGHLRDTCGTPAGHPAGHPVGHPAGHPAGHLRDTLRDTCGPILTKFGPHLVSHAPALDFILSNRQNAPKMPVCPKSPPNAPKLTSNTFSQSPEHLGPMIALDSIMNTHFAPSDICQCTSVTHASNSPGAPHVLSPFKHVSTHIHTS
jgi:hypothetical protein